MLGITLRQLNVFVHIAATGTVQTAAKQLHVTQPAISMALAELERQLDTSLFNRERGRLYLSDRGKELLPLAQEIINRTLDMQHQATALSQTLSGELRIGASNTIGNYLVGDLLGRFTQSHPHVSLQVSVENTQDIVQGLLNFSLDVGCVEGPIHHPQLMLLHWRDDELVVCAAPSDPLAQVPDINAQHFLGAKWILREPGSAMRTLAEQALTSLPAGEILLEFGQVEAIKHAVIAGLGIACLPEAAITDAVAAGRLVKLATPFLHLHRRFSLVLHKSCYQGTVLRAFLTSLDLKQDKENEKPMSAQVII